MSRNVAPAHPAVWFPTVRTHTGTDVFTERLVQGLALLGIQAGITWLPLRAEYAPWTVPLPSAPAWATVAHVNSWMHARLLPRHLPVIVTVHHSVHDPALSRHKGVARRLYHRYWIAPNERRTLRRATSITAVSQYVADMARATLVELPMQVIPNGVDTRVFRPANPPRRPGHPFRLLYVGSWSARKGVDLLGPIMRALGDGFELHYTGGPAAGADKPYLPANMHDIGHLDGDAAVAATMQSADALLFPSRSEGFGLVAAEAMACGLPVVATRHSSLPEVVQEGQSGLLCAPDDIGAFVSAIRRLAKEPTFAALVADSARQRVEQHFSIDTMLADYIQIYQSCMR